MRHKVLSLLLVVATLIGQSFCCCTLRALGSTLKHDSPADSCCCHLSDDSTDGCPDSSKEPGHQCPCKQGKVISANIASESTAPGVFFDGWARQFPVVAQLGRVDLMEVVQAKATYFQPTSFAHLDRTGILRAVSALRC